MSLSNIRDLVKVIFLSTEVVAVVFAIARMWDWQERGMRYIRFFFFAAAVNAAYNGYIALTFYLGVAPEIDARQWGYALANCFEAVAVIWLALYLLGLRNGNR